MRSVLAGFLLNGIHATCPSGYEAFEDICLKVQCGSVASGSVARSDCENEGGFLLAPTSHAMNAFVTGRASYQKTTIGLFDANNDNVYEKLDGTPLTYTNWKPGYPKVTPNANCVYQSADAWVTFWTNDLCENDATCYVCQSNTVVCDDGYHPNAANECEDNDECTDSDYSNNCHPGDNTLCQNTDGGYECICDPSLLTDGYVMGGTKFARECIDVNECMYTNTNDCANNGLTECINNGGSYTCECKAAYKDITTSLGHNAFESDSLTCSNVNECAQELDDCSDNAMCIDNSGTTAGYSCECFDGFLDGDDSNPGRTCNDKDECAEDSIHNRNDCNENAYCVNHIGGFTCFCNSGYTGDGRTCDDVDECATHIDECDALGICTNEEGDYTCECPKGYTGNGYACVDINECETGENDCHVDANCMNMPGSFVCFCKPGFRGTGVECEDFDECSFAKLCDDNADCSNTHGSYNCDCHFGYQGKGDANACTLCSDDSTWAFDGDAVCTCNTGYEGDGDECDDIHECDNETDTCDDNATCTNSVGSYTCACNEAYYGDGEECTYCDPEIDFSEIVVDCDPDGIEIIVPYCAFFNDGITDQTFLAPGDNCIIENTGTNVEMSLPATSECGTKVSHNGTFIVYKNSIIGEVREHYGTITRKKYLDVEFSCGFQAEEDVSFEGNVHAMIDHVQLDLGRQEEKFAVSMGVFVDNSFDEVVPSDYSVIVPDHIYVGMSLHDGEDALLLMAEKCWATPTSDPEDDEQYIFIDNYCGNQAEVDGALDMVQNGVDKTVNFGLQSFEFIGHTEGNIFLHCHGIVCDSEIEDCTIDCSARRRRRRRSTKQQPASLRVGPIRVLGTNN